MKTIGMHKVNSRMFGHGIGLFESSSCYCLNRIERRVSVSVPLQARNRYHVDGLIGEGTCDEVLPSASP